MVKLGNKLYNPNEKWQKVQFSVKSPLVFLQKGGKRAEEFFRGKKYFVEEGKKFKGVVTKFTTALK